MDNSVSRPRNIQLNKKLEALSDASDDAVISPRFVFSFRTPRGKFRFIKVGIVPGDGGAWTLQQIVGYSKAAELFLTGDTFGADEALRIGLVSEVAEDEALMDAALALAGRIAANPVRALRLTKRLLREGQKGDSDQVLELSAAYQAIVHETQDHVEAVTAILEKRKPSFTGG